MPCRSLSRKDGLTWCLKAVGVAHWALCRIRHLSLTPGVPSISLSAIVDRDVALRSLCVPVRHLPLLPRPHRSHLLCPCQCRPVQQLGVRGRRWGGTLPSSLFDKAAVCVCRHTWMCSYFTPSLSGCEVLESGSASSGFGDNFFLHPIIFILAPLNDRGRWSERGRERERFLELDSKS